MRALILERNKRVRRQLVRYFMCAGYRVMAVDEPSLLLANLDGVGVVAADAFDVDLVNQVLLENPAMHGVLWTAEPLARTLPLVLNTSQLGNICGRKDFESAPKSWEVLMVARRLIEPGAPSAKFADFLSWGYSGFQERVASTEQRDATVSKVARFATRLGASNRVGDMLGELAHELLMNAMFDAPVDERGQPKYALDRTAQLTLLEAERPTIRIASDGSQVIIQVIDPFGRLHRQHVFSGLERGLRRGELDASYGGAGLGMAMCHNATTGLFFDVVAGEKTEVIAIFDLDLNVREFRTRAKSLHFFAS